MVFSIITVKANGDFVVLHSPHSVLFNGDEEVEQSLLKEVLAAALGFTVKSVCLSVTSRLSLILTFHIVAKRKLGINMILTFMNIISYVLIIHYYYCDYREEHGAA